MEECYAGILRSIGDRLGDEVVEKTPRRAAEAFRELTAGYRTTVREVVGDALFESDHQGLVVAARIEFHSLCQHHLLPFYGHASVGYAPAGKVVGLSKIPRIVDLFAKRLQLQEHMTDQIARALAEITGARAVGVTVEARHLCAKMRGVSKQDMAMRTTRYLGELETDAALRQEFARLAG